MEEAAASLGAGPFTVFRRIVLPNLAPAIISGAALGFARAIGEFGSVVLISGNLPFKTEVGSVYVFNQIENDNVPAAAAVSMVLLAAALVVVGLLNLVRPPALQLWPLKPPARRSRGRPGHRAAPRASACASSASATSPCSCSCRC